MVKDECLGFFGFFCIIKHFPDHMGQIRIQLTVDTHNNAEHKDSIFAEHGKGPQTEGWDPPSSLLIIM